MKASMIVALAWVVGVAPQAARAQDSGQSGAAPNAATQTAAPPKLETSTVVINGACGSGKPGKTVRLVDPEYPKDAMSAHTEGTVALHALVGTDGAVEKLDYVSGPQILADAATSAAKQWTFAPCLVDGKPSEVETTFSFVFSMTPVVEIQLNGTTLFAAGKLIYEVAPKYPGFAKFAHTEGKVVLHGIIGKDGVPRDLQVVSGPPRLVKASIKAVNQWRYRPTWHNGNPVDVDTTITVYFSLN
ncbi:MAG: energy transducer TonB [Candidatus Acidiferrales bacterium]